MNESKPSKKWPETVAALLMALATMGTAWSSYESAAWTRRAGALAGKANALERRAGLMHLEGNQALTVHAALFMQIMTARQNGNEKLAEFYAARLPAEPKRAYEAWLAQRPFDNPAADPHPFVTNLYVMRFAGESREASDEAAECVQEGARAGAFAGQYLSNTVLCASVLFFAGVAGKFEGQRVRLIMFALAGLILLYVGIRVLALLPVAG